MMKSKKELFRNEWKYLISVGEKELLRLRMSPFLHLDPHARPKTMAIKNAAPF